MKTENLIPENNVSIITIDTNYKQDSLNEDFKFQIYDSSLSPSYNRGDIALCKKLPINTFIQWGKVYVLDTECGQIARRLYPSKKGDLYIKLCCDNDQEFNGIDIKRSDILGISMFKFILRAE